MNMCNNNDKAFMYGLQLKKKHYPLSGNGVKTLSCHVRIISLDIIISLYIAPPSIMCFEL